MIWFRNAAVAVASGGVSTTTAITQFVRNFGKKAAPNLRKINPRVPRQDAVAIAYRLYDLIKQHAPVSVSNTWIHAQEASIPGLTSKTHLKIMLKWMRGQNILKQSCNHEGPTKRFVLTVLPKDLDAVHRPIAPDLRPHTGKPFRAKPKLRKI